MKPYVVLEKPVGETPLSTLSAWKRTHPEHEHTRLTYAGRLDPMASGSLLVLIGDECKKRDRYMQRDKEYEIEILFDIHTDTGDVLGLPTLNIPESAPTSGELSAALQKMRGSHIVPYPAFSSKTVAGKPLFMYALENTLDTISLPTHTETIYRAQLVSLRTLKIPELQKRIAETLSHAPRTSEESKTLGTDFRQGTIKAAWGKLLETAPARTFCVATVRVVCTSGTYMRTLAGRMGSALGTSGMALSIHRSRIGTFLPLLGTGVWIQVYT